MLRVVQRFRGSAVSRHQTPASPQTAVPKPLKPKPLKPCFLKALPSPLNPNPLIPFFLLLLSCSSEPKLTLRLANWAGHLEAAIVEQVLREFEAAHPGVRVVQESHPNQYREKMLTSFAAGTAPDVFLLDSNQVPAFVNRDLVLDLLPFTERVGVDTSRYFPEVLATTIRNGGMFAFPKDFTPLVVYYNKDVLQRSSVAPPEPGWTWDDFVRKCVQVRKNTDGDGAIDQYGTFFLRYFYLYQPFLWNNGGDVLSPDGIRATGYLNSPATTEAFRFLLDWHLRWDFTGPLEIKRNPSKRQTNLFYLGRAGFMVSGHWWLPELRKNMRRRDLRIGVAGLPRVEGKPYANIMYASGWAVSASTRHRKFAIQLAAHMAGEKAQRQTAARGLAIPAMRDIAMEVAARDTTGLEAVFLAEVAVARQPWGTRLEDFTTIEDMLTQIFDRVIWGNEALPGVLDDVADRIDRVLEERRKQRGSPDD